MPRDLPTLPEAAPDLSEPSLEGLAWLLRHREAWPKGFVWDFSDCSQCAVGMIRRLWQGWDKRTWEVVGMERGYARIFCNQAYLPIPDRKVTPELVAKRIEDHLAGRP